MEFIPQELYAYHNEGNPLHCELGRRPFRIDFWEINDLSRFNNKYDVKVLAPGYVGFGVSGDGQMFAFAPSGAIVCMPLALMEPESAVQIAQSWGDFVSQLHPSEGRQDSSHVRPPSAVRGAIICFALVICIGFTQAMLRVSWERPIIIVFGWSVVISLYVLVLKACYRGRNWARFFTAIAFGLNVTGFFFLGGRENSEFASDPATYFGFAINALAVGLLFVPSASRWYAECARN